MANGSTSWIHVKTHWENHAEQRANPFRSTGRDADRGPFPLLLVLLGLLLLAGCTSEVESEKTVVLEKPSAQNGVVIEEDDPVDMEKLAEAVDSLEMSAPAGDSAFDPGTAEDQGSDVPARISVTEAMSMAGDETLPADSTELITLPKLSRMETNEITEHLVLSLGSELSYAAATGVVTDSLPAPPEGVGGGSTVTRPGESGTRVLRFGYRYFVSQPPQFWAMGVIVAEDGSFSVNPDLAQLEPKVSEVVASIEKMRTALTVRDLETKLVQLSYVDAQTALSMLKGFGVTTLNKPSEVPTKVEYAQLPYAVAIEDPKPSYTGLVGAKTTTNSKVLSMAPGVASELEDNAIASPMTQLMVMFHPAHPEQYSEVRRLLDTFVDRPARQIFIEAMVLEISEEGLKDLGVEWELNESPLEITGGALVAGGTPETLRMHTPDTSMLNEIFEGSEFEWDWEVTIRALIRSGKAEILSRPSVLTLNNRQSTIRVGRDIPIASSLEGMSNYSNKVSFKFEYLPTGILLNIRPRVTETGSEVSMLIDTIVSSKVPNSDLVMRAGDGTILASAPTISTRRVQTYGRIPNNTPLIIGGLVARENTLTRDKIPVLGDLPFVGFAFRAEKNEHTKREVIIVLTPHVLPDQKVARQSLPKDEDAFDSFGNELFRDSYRIRSEDVFDLSFLLENKRIAAYRQRAREVAEKDFRLAAIEPFHTFMRDTVPGESILVTRMIYEVIKRLNIAEKIESSRIIYFEGQQVGGYSVEFLKDLITDEATGKMKDFGEQALAITYRYDRASLEEGRLGSEPIPDIRMISCPDRKAWGEKLWELNQPTPDGHERHTILIQNESDVLRLRRALALKRIAVLNGGLGYMRLRNFSVGKVLLMPELKPGQIHVVDADTARFFFHTEHYYAATLAKIEKDLKELDEMLRRPDIRILLDSGLPGGPSAKASESAVGGTPEMR